MASWILLLAGAIGAAPGESGSQLPSTEFHRPFHEIQRQISDLLKREAQAKSPAARAATVTAMCGLHREIVQDPRYATSDVLKEYRSRLWSRLSRIKAELKQHLARNRDEEALDYLAALEAADAASIAASESLADSLSLLAQTQGGPTRLLAMGGAAGPADWGPDLVDLIERTINPAFWDVVGGPGTIIYYQPLQCLVVRATGEVHAKIGGAIGDLRAAGR
jgi:hypothetical protein